MFSSWALFQRCNAWHSVSALTVSCWLSCVAATAQISALEPGSATPLDGTANDPPPGSIPSMATATAPASPITPPPATSTPELDLPYPSAINTARLVSGSKSVILFGIIGLQQPDTVRHFNNFLGATVTHLRCRPQSNGHFVCLTQDGTDLAAAALRHGAAQVSRNAPQSYRDQQAAAQAEGTGIWAPPPPPPVKLHNPIVRDTATLVAGSQTYVLDGIIGFGAPYAGQLQDYIVAHGNTLNCQPHSATAATYVCVTEDNTDIAALLLTEGAARTVPDAPDAYRVQQADALANHRGYWTIPAPEAAIASTPSQPTPTCCAPAPVVNARRAFPYNGDVPLPVIAGPPAFLAFTGVPAWQRDGHGHHWHRVPDPSRPLAHSSAEALRPGSDPQEAVRHHGVNETEAHGIMHIEQLHPAQVAGQEPPFASPLAPGVEVGQPGPVMTPAIPPGLPANLPGTISAISPTRLPPGSRSASFAVTPALSH
jgi:endonuclease YncB( thermonuclease family)